MQRYSAQQICCQTSRSWYCESTSYKSLVVSEDRVFEKTTPFSRIGFIWAPQCLTNRHLSASSNHHVASKNSSTWKPYGIVRTTPPQSILHEKTERYVGNTTTDHCTKHRAARPEIGQAMSWAAGGADATSKYPGCCSNRAARTVEWNRYQNPCFLQNPCAF